MEIRATHDHPNVGSLAFSAQKKAECVAWYNETEPVTQTQRNRRGSLKVLHFLAI